MGISLPKNPVSRRVTPFRRESGLTETEISETIVGTAVTTGIETENTGHTRKAKDLIFSSPGTDKVIMRVHLKRGNNSGDRGQGLDRLTIEGSLITTLPLKAPQQDPKGHQANRSPHYRTVFREHQSRHMVLHHPNKS